MKSLSLNAAVAEVRCRKHRTIVGTLRAWTDEHGMAPSDGPAFLEHDHVSLAHRAMRNELGGTGSDHDFDGLRLHCYINGAPAQTNMVQTVLDATATHVECWCRRCAGDVRVSVAALRAALAGVQFSGPRERKIVSIPSE